MAFFSDGFVSLAWSACFAGFKTAKNMSETKTLWRCPVCDYVMTEEQSKGYSGCPTGIHFAQHEPYESQALATVPPDLADALVASPRAARAFESLSKTRRYAVILDLVTTRTPRTRSAHLRKAIAALEASAD